MTTLSAACAPQAATPQLDFRELVLCNIVVEDHVMHGDLGTLVSSDGTLTEIGQRAAEARRQWMVLAVERGKSMGKTPADVEGEIVAARKDRNKAEYAELDRLRDLHTKSEPSLRLMPYYVRLSEPEREELVKKQRAISDDIDRKSDERYAQCIAKLQ